MESLNWNQFRTRMKGLKCSRAQLAERYKLYKLGDQTALRPCEHVHVLIPAPQAQLAPELIEQHLPELVEDAYECIARQIDDPITYRNFLLAAKVCQRRGTPLRALKEKEFFAEETSQIVDPDRIDRLISGPATDAGYFSRYFGANDPWFIYQRRFLYERPVRSAAVIYHDDQGEQIIRVKGVYIDSQMQGLWSWYNPAGKLEITSSHQDDHLHGPLTTYDTDIGRIHRTMNFEDGLLHGPLILYYYSEEEKINRITNYRHGVEHGRYEVRNTRNQIIAEGEYVNDQKEGEWRTYYSNRKIRDIETYENDEIINEVRYWSNGNLRARIAYRDGVPSRSELYDRSGNFIKVVNHRIVV